MRIKIKNKMLLAECFKKILSKNIDNKFNGISIDSRNLEQDDIFIATKEKDVMAINSLIRNY